jgi:hypothetical protein
VPPIRLLDPPSHPRTILLRQPLCQVTPAALLDPVEVLLAAAVLRPVVPGNRQLHREPPGPQPDSKLTGQGLRRVVKADEVPDCPGAIPAGKTCGIEDEDSRVSVYFHRRKTELEPRSELAEAPPELRREVRIGQLPAPFLDDADGGFISGIRGPRRPDFLLLRQVPKDIHYVMSGRTGGFKLKLRGWLNRILQVASRPIKQRRPPGIRLPQRDSDHPIQHLPGDGKPRSIRQLAEARKPLAVRSLVAERQLKGEGPGGSFLRFPLHRACRRRGSPRSGIRQCGKEEEIDDQDDRRAESHRMPLPVGQ